MRVWEEMVKMAELNVQPNLGHGLLLMGTAVELYKSMVSRINARSLRGVQLVNPRRIVSITGLRCGPVVRGLGGT